MIIQLCLAFFVPSESLDRGNDNANRIVCALLHDIVFHNRQAFGGFDDVSLRHAAITVFEFAIQAVAGELKLDFLSDFFHRGRMIAHVGVARNLHLVQIRMAHTEFGAGQTRHVLVLDHNLWIALEAQVLVCDAHRRLVAGSTQALVADFVPWEAGG